MFVGQDGYGNYVINMLEHMRWHMNHTQLPGVNRAECQKEILD